MKNLLDKQITFKYTAFTDFESIEKTITLRFRASKEKKIVKQQLEPIKCHGNDNSAATIEKFLV